MTAQIYVGTYAKYNNGSISGGWINCEEYADKEEFLQACAMLHADEKDPEFMFQDFEGFPKDFYAECSINDMLWDFLALDNHEREIVEAYLSAESLRYVSNLQEIVDSFIGAYDDWADYAQQLTEETSNIPDHLVYYIDYEKMGRDMSIEHHGYSAEYDGKLWLFADR